ncbi:hypothetical protein BD779DRAFT_1535020 [Infundibulicybe gibba]|nr:hypothetical protein BD779DRAFT_1535020 [Infundibulicybe gibba]
MSVITDNETSNSSDGQELLLSSNGLPHDISQPQSSGHKGRFSIDLSLELERELDMESLPPTPAHNALTHTPTPTRESLDPDVLAHIVMQLRQSLAEVSKERDDLVSLLASAHSKEAQLKDTLQHITDKAMKTEEDLENTRKKVKDDEEAITMLRSKVEESRRGLMRLQTESRRQSTGPMAIDMSRAGLPSFGSPPSSKRASFTPMTGHRRISSISDVGINSLVVPESNHGLSPNSQTLTLPGESPLPTPPMTNSRRVSGIFGRTSPPQFDPNHVEVESLKKEVQTLKDTLEETRNELSESNEAKEASETCVKALREYIADNNVGAVDVTSPGSMKPPPPPATQSVSDAEAKRAASTAGWAFKLWKGEAVPKATPAPNPPVAVVSSPQPAAPLSRKIGGFFSSRASISSVTSNTSTLPQLQTNAANTIHDPRHDSIYSFSDTSSVAEPISPTSDVHVRNVIVRDVTSGSDLGSVGASPEGIKSLQITAET